MNISTLKRLVAGLPDEITSVQMGAIEVEFEDLLAQQRAADEAELAETLARAAALQARLGIAKSNALAAMSVRTSTANVPLHVMGAPERGDTDADNGVTYGDDGASGQSFRDEVSAIRQHNVERRRHKGH